jgi:hypothetical protein
VIGYPSKRLHEEVAYLAYYFHWSHDEIMRMEHRDRVRWVAEVGRINERLNGPSTRRPSY